MPSKAEILRPYVESVVREYLEIPEGGELKKDDDGDIPIRWGSAIYYVRLVDRDPVLVRVFSVVLRGVELSHELLQELNETNQNVVSARVFWADGDIVASLELPAETLDAGDFSYAAWAVGSLADWADTELQPRFGGEKMLEDEEAGDGTSVDV